jgi:hypothetical protein
VEELRYELRLNVGVKGSGMRRDCGYVVVREVRYDDHREVEKGNHVDDVVVVAVKASDG